jgi:hypothetical protein
MKSFKLTPIDINSINSKDIKIIKQCNKQNVECMACINNLKNKLNYTKSQLDKIYVTDYKKAFSLMKKNDPFLKEKYNISRIVNTHNMTNAWLKGYEIIEYYDLIPKNIHNFVYFDNASFPGSFIIAVNHYIKTKTNIKNFKWYGSSLIGKDKLYDDFDLKKNYPNNWIMNNNNNGDITVLSNIMNFQMFFKNIFWPKPNQNNNDNERTLNLYSCDLGLDWGNDYNNQESLSFKANLCQILCGLLTLNTNGHMFIKHFTLFEPFTLSYLSLLTLLFKEVYISKPSTSRRSNSEVYIVAKFYKFPFEKNSTESKIIDLLISCISEHACNKDCKTNNPPNNPFSNITFISNKFIIQQILNITDACKNIYNTQIETLNKFVNYLNIPNYLQKNKRQYLNNLNTENKIIINNFKKINIKKINNLDNLLMKIVYN